MAHCPGVGSPPRLRFLQSLSQGHGGDVKCCTFIGDSAIATGAMDNIVRVWQVMHMAQYTGVAPKPHAARLCPIFAPLASALVCVATMCQEHLNVLTLAGGGL